MKKYTMQDFINGKVAVRTGHNWKLLLELCEKHNLRWNCGQRAIEKTHFDYGKALVIECNFYKNGKLTYNDGNYTGAPVTIGIRHFMQMVKGQPSYQITIDCDGDTTTARMIVNGKEVKTAKATRNPADKFNWKMGAQLAFDRLWGEKKVKEVKRHAKIGEYVKVVAAEHLHHETYKTNDIRRVERYFGCGEGWVYLEGATTCACSPKEYVVLEGYKPGK